ncbi:MAG: 2-oxoglutarate dehydrogenase complex dihydrolipoyllysine-residue succinyltransferase [Gammaproteobacteria bacterium]|nr:2-oxoglutarate dehydrogenase complex dihydrolipoyllysine-residue succinyltransferase [Gammaproteobacteria bacterium]
MSIEVKVPQLPESVADATLVNWHKKAGDRVERDENLVDIETDKVVLEVPAPASGVLKEIKVEDGTTVGSEDVIAILEEGEGGGDTSSDDSGSDDSGDKEEKKEEKTDKEDKKEKSSKSKSSSKPLSPSVRRLVEEHDLDPEDIEGTGKDGRLTKADVLEFIESGGKKQSKVSKESSPQQRPSTSGSSAPSGSREERRVPMSRLRARVAERMMEANNDTAMLTSFNEVDLTEVMNLRKKYKDKFADEHGVKLGFMSFFVKAATEALKKFPVVNASVEGNDILYHDYFDVGIAVSTDKGLVVPVLRDTDQMSLADIENGIAEYAKKAREGKLALDDMTGGTFTITNGGVFGSLFSTPILNRPQSAILGMHAIKERAVVVDGKVEARPMMYIALTYDHRIIDGREAVLTLVTIKDMLEDPARLLMGI